MLRSGIIVALLTLLSRCFGLARELFIATTFGCTAIADCVNIAFKLPNLFRRIFGEGALSAVFIPIFNEKLLHSKSSAIRFSGEVFTLLLLTLIALAIIMQIFMPYLMVLIAPGFYLKNEKYDLAIILCRITTPYLIFISITALFGGMLNSVKKFASFAFTPIIMNICVIAFTLALQKKIPAHYGISISLLIAGILQIGFMYFCLVRAQLTFSMLFHIKDKDVKNFLKNMGPATMSSGAQQLNLFISQSIASFLPGAVSILSYADRLYQLPLALIGVTFGTILLPKLSQLYQKNNYSEANFLQNKAIKIALFISIPAMFGLIMLANPIIHIIYERGAFSTKDTVDTSCALTAFAFGLPAFILAKILTPIFYANLDTKTPYKITLYSLGINTLINFLLLIPLEHFGIAIGSSIAAWINVWLLNKYTKNYGNFRITSDTKLFALKILFNSVLMSMFIYLTQYYFRHLFYSEHFIIKVISLLGTISVAILIFISFSFIQNLHKTLIKKYEQNL